MSSKAFQSFGTLAVFRVAFPLMLVALTSNMMLFFGRMVLAKYDIHAMNAATSTMLICNVFQIAGLSITTMAEIFVGQHNGAGNLKQVPNAVWQMIWISLAMTIIFVPIALLGGEFLVADKFKALGMGYFQITMLSGFLIPLLGALASFFIGTGQVAPLIVSAVFANIVNAGLNIALVFGVENLVPPMGVNGAAIATVIALSGQVLFLFLVFTNDMNHSIFGTRRATFDKLKMIKCFKIGFPNALGRMIEIAGWATLFAYLSTVSESYVTVQTLCHSLIIMFMFTVEGLSKGVTAIVSNVIGQGDLKAINKIVRSSGNILFVILIVLWGVLWYAPEATILKIMNEAQFVDVELKRYVTLALKGLWIYFAFNGLSLIIWGVLTAGGDTKFIMWSNTLSTWLFAVIPTYIWVAYFPATPAIPYLYIAPVYGFLGFIIVAIRFYQKKWLKLDLTNEGEVLS
jgi:MATE family multidrug resistance protein